MKVILRRPACQCFFDLVGILLFVTVKGDGYKLHFFSFLLIPCLGSCLVFLCEQIKFLIVYDVVQVSLDI